MESYNTWAETLPFGVLVAAARLGRKYQMDELYRRAVLYLANVYPKSLPCWDELAYRERMYAATHAASAVRLALELGLDVILPAAYLAIIRCDEDIETIWKLDIPLEAMKNLLIGREQLAAQYAARYLRPLVGECNNSTCTELKSRLDEEQTVFSGGFIEPSCILDQAADFMLENMIYERLCKPCADDVKASYEEGRWALWDKLPSAFGLASWSLLYERLKVSHGSHVMA